MFVYGLTRLQTFLRFIGGKHQAAKSFDLVWIIRTLCIPLALHPSVCPMRSKHSYIIIFLMTHCYFLYHQNETRQFLLLNNRWNTKLTAHNWQKWKRVVLTCPCHKIYRVEAVGLKSCNYTWKIMIFANVWNFGQFHEKLIFCQELLNWSSNLKILLHIIM